MCDFDDEKTEGVSRWRAIYGHRRQNSSWAEEASNVVTRVDSWQALKHIAIKLYSDLIDAHVGRLAGTDSDYSKAASTSATHSPISFPLMAHGLDSQTRFGVHEDQVCLPIPSFMIRTHC
jgi:hypothetical protein